MKEIIEAMLYEIQESGYSSEEKLKAGVVVTGGGADLVNCANLIKEMSGYSVKIGPPRPYFSYEGCLGVQDPSASASVGMILAAKNDYMLNCVKEPPEPNWWEKVLAQEKASENDPQQEEEANSAVPEPVEAEEAATEAAEPTIEDTVASGQEYTAEEEPNVFSAPTKEEREAYEQKKKIEKAREVAQRKEKKMHFQWIKKLTKKVGDMAGSIYDDMNEEEV
jgi:cell division ATPase FtsA